jgi:hypothetical protein
MEFESYFIKRILSKFEPLWFYRISAKRYVLYNIVDLEIGIQRHSLHCIMIYSIRSNRGLERAGRRITGRISYPWPMEK